MVLRGRGRSDLTHRALGSQSTCFISSLALTNPRLFVVARIPSSVPFPFKRVERPRRKEPVHTVNMPLRFEMEVGEEKNVVKYVTRGFQPGSSEGPRRVPRPPGMKRISMGWEGGDVNVWVGVIFCSKGMMLASVPPPPVEGRVDTGERVEERMERRRGREGY